MWDGLLVLLLLCIVMAAASFLVGSLPLSFSLSSRQLRLITALGTGVLVGTSLIVIIPEGVETLYSASSSSHGNAERSLSLITARAAIPGAFIGSLKHDTWRREASSTSADIIVTSEIDARSTTAQDETPGNPGSNPEEGVPTEDPADNEEEQDDQDHDTPDHPSHDPHAWVGISLITGFILMYLIDTLPRHASTPTQPQRFHISLNQFSLNRSPSINTDETSAATTSHSSSSSSSSRPSSTTVGLVIHAVADGIALGASSSSTSTRHLSFIIFLALMIHKAPAAFGLTSVLLAQGLSKRMARAHLIVFSLAAPVGALFTWGAAHILGYSSSVLGSSGSTEFATGVLLLFSGGTFLYVAMHTMQEAGGAGHGHDHGHGGERGVNGYAGVPMSDMYEASVGMAGSTMGPRKDGGRLTDTLVCVLGMLLPLLTQFGHGH